MLNNLTKTTIMASLGLMLCANAANAADTNDTNTTSTNNSIKANTVNTDWKGDQKGSIDNLAKSGSVSLRGTVESVDNDKKRFVISDNTGDTIDVHTNSAVELKEGDNVSVKGKMESEVAGIGKEITSASVQINK